MSFDSAIPMIIAAILVAILVASAVFLSRSILRRQERRQVQRSRDHWRLAESLAHELRGPQADERIDDLIFLARAEAGHILTRVRLRELIQESLLRVSPAGEAQWRVHEGGDPHVQADEGALGHALDLVLRAMVDHQTHTVVQIQLTADGRNASVTIIAKAHFNHQHLAVATRIVQAQGGQVQIEDRSITLRMPLSL